MVRFVNFSDSIGVTAATDTVVNRGMAMRVDAVLTVDPGSTINVNLSPDGSNKVQILGNGTLNYSLSPFGESRVTAASISTRVLCATRRHSYRRSCLTSAPTAI